MADLDRVDQGAVVRAAEGQEVGDPAAVEDLAADLDRAAADQEAVVRAAEGQEGGDPVVEDPAEEAEDRVEDLEEEQVEVAEPEGEPGRVESRASG